MADKRPPLLPLQLIEGEADGYCDPVTGMCAVPEAANITETTPASETQSSARGGPAPHRPLPFPPPAEVS